jgi:hypothetical protein
MSSTESQHVVDLDMRLASLNKARPDCLYYAITLTADEDGKIVFGTQTQWVGWKDEGTREELREARLVYPAFVELWQHARQPYSVIHTADDMSLFLLGGGNALVEKDLAKRFFPYLLGPGPSIPDGEIGFASPGLLPETAFRRAPSPKIRMQVLKRDGRRCRICGRRPDDNSDLVLHVHRIRPREKGGVTELKNLITLCHTCHSGLSPHEDRSLFSYLRTKSNDSVEHKLLEFTAAVSRYRNVGFFSELKQARERRGPHRRQRRSTPRAKRSE